MSEANGKKRVIHVAKALRGVTHSNPADEVSRKAFPNIYELLCPVWKEGVCIRQPGRLTISVDGGAYTVKIECPSEQWQGLVTLPSLARALEDLEAAIVAKTVNWTATWSRRKKMLTVVDDAIE